MLILIKDLNKGNIMNSKLVKLINDCLKFSISKDETRPNLNGVYFDSKGENAVSTDGYIMTCSKHKYDAELADKIVNFKDMSIVKREFLKYDAIIPKKFKNKATVIITKGLYVKQKRVEIKAYFTLENGFILSSTPLENYEFAINPEFLKPLIGNTLDLEYNGALAPIRFTLVDQDSYYIIMPMKG
jgi:DNA polymerase III sliding clamp (beta) subunit (PCNA family)